MSVSALQTSTTRGSLEPWIKDEVQYYPHQIEGIRQLAMMRSFLLADDMGLGKSLQALTVFGIDVYRGYSKSMIVVCPVTLIGNWLDEVEKFTRFHATTLTGGPKARSEQLKEFAALDGPKVLVVNYEKVRAHQIELDSMLFDVGVFDEAHYLKSHKSQRTKACHALNVRRKFLLTGTPMLNRVDELWSLMHMIDPAAYPAYWPFVNRYAVFGGWKNKQIIGVQNERELTDRINLVMLRRLKEDVLDLPEVQYIERRVDLLPEQKLLYDSVKDDLSLPRVGELEPDVIENALTKFLRLKQICGTTQDFIGEDISGKLDLVIEDDLEVIGNGHRVIVFTQFRSVLEAYVQRMKKHKIPTWQLHGDVKKEDRQSIVKDWSNATKPGAIVCMLQVAGVGLNMTAARHVVFVDELFVPGLNKQAVDRAHRIGADESQPVQVRRYLTRNTIESRVQSILKGKTKLIGSLIETDPDWKKKLLTAMLEDGENVA